jgi:hypothetical protein
MSASVPSILVNPTIELPELYEIVNCVVEEKHWCPESLAVASHLADLMDRHARATGLGHILRNRLFLLNRTMDLQRRPDIALMSNRCWPGGKPFPECDALERVSVF